MRRASPKPALPPVVMDRPLPVWGGARRAKADGNAKMLDGTFIAWGASVLKLDEVGDGAPDRLVGYDGVDALVEYKNPEGRNRVEPSQRVFHRFWRGRQIAIVSCQEDVRLSMLNLRQAAAAVRRRVGLTVSEE